MENTIISETKINFYESMFDLLCSDNNTDDNCCLISQEPLEEKYITLNCNHSFNYSSIFFEICNQKNNKSILEVQHLKKYEIKCPYCRTVQSGILPYHPKFPKISQVNWPQKQSFIKNPNMFVVLCKSIIKSGKRKGLQCNCKVKSNGFCGRHNKTQNVSTI